MSQCMLHRVQRMLQCALAPRRDCIACKHAFSDVAMQLGSSTRGQTFFRAAGQHALCQSQPPEKVGWHYKLWMPVLDIHGQDNANNALAGMGFIGRPALRSNQAL